jgi:hypothetical protein
MGEVRIERDLFIPAGVTEPSETVVAWCNEDDCVANVEMYRWWNCPGEKVLAVRGTIKWDGCADLEFVDGNSPVVHICGADGWVAFCDAMRAMFVAAFEAMGDHASEAMGDVRRYWGATHMTPDARSFSETNVHLARKS